MRGSSNFRFNRIVPGVGRIHCSSGTDTRVEFNRRNAILTKLIEGGHLDTLRYFHRGTLTIGDLVNADRGGRLAHLADHIATLGDLEAAFEEWLTLEADLAPRTARRYRGSFDRFIKLGPQVRLPSTPTLADLGQLNWARVKKQWGASDYDWQNFRIMLSSFLNHAKRGMLRPLRNIVIDAMPPTKLPPSRKTVLSPQKFGELVRAAKKEIRPALVTMAALGTGPDEYLHLVREDLHPEEYVVHVRGTKRRKRDRLVSVDPRLWSWVVLGVPSPLAYRWLSNHFKTAAIAVGLPALRLYDLRHLSGQAASRSGVTVQEIAQHMGHTQLSTTMGYLEGPMAEAAAKGIADTLAPFLI
jgi:integrase